MTAEDLAALTKTNPTLLTQLQVLGQDKPVVVQTAGGAMDITYANTVTVDLAKLEPPQPAYVKHAGARKVTTELSIHIAPSK